jgi:outer membrane protein OmpA-like peptidoglycan-associated protein
MNKILIIIGFSLICGLSASAQDLSTKSKKAAEFHVKALEYYRQADLSAAREFTAKALEKDSLFTESLILMAQIYEEQEQINLSILYYSKAISCGLEVYPQLLLFRGNIYLKNGKYKDALQDYDKFSSFVTDVGTKRQISDKIKRMQEIMLITENPVLFNPIKLCDSINSNLDEYAAQINYQNNMILFTRAYSTPSNHSEDIFISYRENNHWQTAQKAGTLFNSQGNEGSSNLSADLRFLVFAACNRPDGLGRCDIYICEFDGLNWSAPKNMGAPISSKDWESQPSISSDGKTLYFVSNRKGGLGKADIWISRQNEQGQWQIPENAGENINTRENESYPFIHANNRSLYFGSEGHLNLGSFDIFLSKSDSAKQWGKAQNIGYPVNSNADENSLFVHPNGKSGYMSTSKFSPNKNLDIYEFELAPEIQTDGIYVFKGYVLDSVTKTPLNAQIVIENFEKEIFQTESFKNTGHFHYLSAETKEITVNIYANTYTFFSQKIDFPFDIKEKYFYLNKIQESSKTSFHFNFAYNSDKLPENDMSTVKHLAEYLKLNPGVNILIEGHTDNTGNAEYNKELAGKRAKTVYELLIKSGVAPTRLQYKGYGAEKPMVENNSEKNRAMNRRTDILYRKE